ncbi:MAG TPA: acylphosphatase [Jatrophihabitantaceae bacterium]|nr:acylphosphatase [Jatrophihabitantaceae bacterium]
MPVVARRVVVRGRVQGVFFRDSCRREAQARGVTGWVSNRADGAVEALFEGEQTAVEQMCAWCRHGTPYADVTGIEVTAAGPSGASGFIIR